MLLKDIADKIGAQLIGDGSIDIKAVANLKTAKEDEISFLSDPKYRAVLSESKAGAVILKQADVEHAKGAALVLADPYVGFAKVAQLLDSTPAVCEGIHPTAVVDSSVKLGQNVCIGPNVVISPNVVIGDNTKILANTYVGSNAKIGSKCFIHPGVNIGDRVQIGNDVILHHGVSLGSDGFSFVTENPNNIENARQDGEIKEGDVEQVIFKIPSIGSVVIGNNVEIGANTTIDRGTIENTTIGDNTKIDDLVMIGHNCKIGKGCLIVSQVGIAGSCVIGDRVVIAGQAGLADHIEIGSDTIITAKAGVTKSFPEKSIIVGIPAVPRKDFIKQLKTMKDAQEIFAKFRKYEPLLKEFEENVSK